MLRNRRRLYSVMEFVSFWQHEAVGTQVCALFEPLQMALSRMRVGYLILLHQFFKRLDQQAGDRSLSLHGE